MSVACSRTLVQTCQDLVNLELGATGKVKHRRCMHLHLELWVIHTRLSC